jgi:BirA family biotin operon repressor/biotin-[acetyl-CoA-carboxylase] ligase
MSADLSPTRVAGLLAGTPAAGWRVLGGVPTGSTMDDARGLSLAGDPGPLVVVATSQTGGRGRFSRAWESPDGGVYLSALVPPAIPPEGLGPLPLVAGLGIAEGLEAVFGVRLTLKWPNDLRAPLADGSGPGKVGGLLVESGVAGARVERLVVGCGLNVAPPEPPGPRTPGAAYLADLVDGSLVPLERARVAAAAIAGLAESLETFRRSGFEALAAGYEARSDIIGTEVTVRDAGGGPVASGTVTGFDRTGRLVVASGGREQSVAAGEVTLRE